MDSITYNRLRRISKAANLYTMQKQAALPVISGLSRALGRRLGSLPAVKAIRSMAAGKLGGLMNSAHGLTRTVRAATGGAYNKSARLAKDLSPWVRAKLKLKPKDKHIKKKIDDGIFKTKFADKFQGTDIATKNSPEELTGTQWNNLADAVIREDPLLSKRFDDVYFDVVKTTTSPGVTATGRANLGQGISAVDEWSDKATKQIIMGEPRNLVSFLHELWHENLFGTPHRFFNNSDRAVRATAPNLRMRNPKSKLTLNAAVAQGGSGFKKVTDKTIPGAYIIGSAPLREELRASAGALRTLRRWGATKQELAAAKADLRAALDQYLYNMAKTVLDSPQAKKSQVELLRRAMEMLRKNY